jgi:small subunit ribosomal protein S3
MGQKVHPIGMRLGITKEHNSQWFASNKRDYADKLNEDLKIRALIAKQLKNGSVSRVLIQRPASTVLITIFTARPGVVIGKKGEDVAKLRIAIGKIVNTTVQINIEEIRKAELDATLVAQGIASQLEKRVMFRRAMKRAIQNATRLGAKGIKIQFSGRLGGAEIARTEWQREGRVPLHTLRADIDYSCAEAMTVYGIIGVKVWIFKGEIIGDSGEKTQSTDKPVKKEGRPSKKRQKAKG